MPSRTGTVLCRSAQIGGASLVGLGSRGSVAGATGNLAHRRAAFSFTATRKWRPVISLTQQPEQVSNMGLKEHVFLGAITHFQKHRFHVSDQNGLPRLDALRMNTPVRTGCSEGVLVEV